MDITTYLKPLFKYWWLIVIASLVAAASSYLVTRRQPPIYQAHTTLVIGRAVYEANPNSGDFWLNQQLASYYADIAQRDVVRQGTMQVLGLQWLPAYSVQPLPNSQLLEIAVTDSSPIRAQAVANELANQLIKQSPTSSKAEDQTRQQFVEEQLNNLQKEITNTQDELAQKQAQLAELNSARQIADAQAEIAGLQTKLSSLQTNYATLLANSGQGAANSLTVIEPAALPSVPVGPNNKMIILLSTAIAFAIACGAAYLLEYLDDTLKDPEEITRRYNLPVIGYLSQATKGKLDGTYVANKPRSLISDAFRYLRINLEFVGVDKPSKTILITSSAGGEGKTTIATNLAIVMAQGGKKTMLLDADLRKPSVHTALGISNQKGLSDVFRGGIGLLDAITPWKDLPLYVVTAGAPPPNPADLLGSKKMDKIIEGLEEIADVVIIDGPPSIVADAAILANKVDGVLFVVRYGVSRRGRVAAALSQLNRTGAHIIGAALNVLPQGSEHGYAYNYSGYYYDEDHPPEDAQRKNGKWSVGPKWNSLLNMIGSKPAAPKPERQPKR